MEKVAQTEKIDEIGPPWSKGEVGAAGLSPDGQGAALGAQARTDGRKTDGSAKNLVSKVKVKSRIEILREGNNRSHSADMTNFTPECDPRTQMPYAAQASYLADSELTDLKMASFKRPRPDEAEEEDVSPEQWKEAVSKFESSDFLGIVGDVMTPKSKVLFAVATEPMSKVECLLHVGGGVSGVPVLDDGDSVVGVISKSDFDGMTLKTDSWRQDPVSKYMSNKPKVVRRVCKIRDAASLLQEHGIYRLPVVDEEQRLIGIVTRYDLVKNFVEFKRMRKDQVQTPKVYTEEEKLEMLRQWVTQNWSADRRMPTSKENWLVDGRTDQPFGIGRWLNRLKGRVMKEYRKDPEASNDGQRLLDGPICEILRLEPGWWKEEERWERKLTELKVYMKRNGEIPRKSKDRNLYHFVTKQREKHQSGDLSDWRKKKLEEIPGWEWDDGTVIPDADWEQKYQDLEKFLSANNKMLPTLQNNNALYWFLEHQRRSHSNGTLTQPRKDKLDALLGMGWWNKEGHNEAQLPKTEDVNEQVDIEDDIKEKSDVSLHNETNKDKDAADILLHMSLFNKPAKNPHKQPITDPEELTELKGAGMTQDGEKRIMGADTRCRPSAALKNLFDPKFPEFRLPSAVSSAKAEDIVNLWAILANLTPNKEVPFNFNQKIYRHDKPLMDELRKLIPAGGGRPNPEPLKEFLKRRFKSRSLIMKRKSNEFENESMGDSKANEQINPDAVKKELIAAPAVRLANDRSPSGQQARTLQLTVEDRHSFSRSKRFCQISSDNSRLDAAIQLAALNATETSKDGASKDPEQCPQREEKLKALEIRWKLGHRKSSFRYIPVCNDEEVNAQYDLDDEKGLRKFNLGEFVHDEIKENKKRTREELEALVKAMHLDENMEEIFWNRCKRANEKAGDRDELLMVLDTRWQNGHTHPGFKEIPGHNHEERSALYDLGDGKGPRKFNPGPFVSNEITEYKKGNRGQEQMEELAKAMHLSEEALKAFWEKCNKDNGATDSDWFLYPEKRQRKKETWLDNLEMVREHNLPLEWPTKDNLGAWLRRQKKSYVDNTLASEPGKEGTSKEEKRRLLEELPGWSDYIKPKGGAHSEKLSVERLRELDSRFNTLLRVLEEWKTHQAKVHVLRRKHFPAQRDIFTDSETGEKVPIGGWIQNYKKSAKNGILESIEKLAEIGKILGIGENWWQSNSPPIIKDEAKDDTHLRTDQDEDIEILFIETPENDGDVGVLPKEDIKVTTSAGSTVSIPQNIRDNFANIERDIIADKKNFDYTRLALFHSDLYSITKDDVFKWAQKKISEGISMKNYDDIYIKFFTLIRGDIEDNALEKVSKEMRKEAKKESF